jgi:hypothetical protein
MLDRPLRPKPLFFHSHAVQRMQERGFSVTDVKRILYTGDKAESSVQKHGMPYRFARQLVVREKPAKVIFCDEPHRYFILTVEWVY